MLINKIKEAINENNKVSVFKPKIDVRYNPEKIVSHEKDEISAIPVNNSKDILDLAKKSSFVAIDEAQFFDLDIVATCVQLAKNNTQVVLAGLDMDYLGNPFGPIPNLMATAEYVTKVHAVCKKSGNIANYSFRKNKKTDIVVIGEKDKYEPLSRAVFFRKMKKDK